MRWGFATMCIQMLFVSCLAGCERELTDEQRVAKEFNDLAWSLMEPLKSATECKKLGQALKAWETQHGARFKELAAKVVKLEGGYADNFQRVQQRFRQVANYCIHPKTTGVHGPQMEHDDNVERVYQMLPDFKERYELK